MASQDFKHIVLPHTKLNPRYMDREGIISIGGDKVDVYARSAYMRDDETVVLENVRVIDLRNTFDEGDSDALMDEAISAIYECYDSIQTDTFIPHKSGEFPPICQECKR